MVAGFWKQFGSERTSHAISKKIRRLEANGGPTAQLNLWTAEEDVFIRNNIQSKRDELFRLFQARFRNFRTRQMVYNRRKWLGQFSRIDVISVQIILVTINAIVRQAYFTLSTC